MKASGGPARDFSKLQKAIKAVNDAQAGNIQLDFDDTKKTFAHLSDKELKQSARLFTLMGKPWLTNTMSNLGMHAVRLGLPGAEWVVKKTIYPQFVG
ncbi:MAG: proline dehydrogenase, partial [Bacteroidota bacterium]